MASILKNHRLPVQIEGFPYIFGALLLTLSSAMIWKAAVSGTSDVGAGARWAAATGTFVFGVFTAFCIWFYRNPNRKTPTDDPRAVISPADGRVLSVTEVSGNRIGAEKARKVSIFMSPMDVHVNRAPITGVVEGVQYNSGKFFKADLDKASEENENNWLIMKSDRGQKLLLAK
ncbi:MAG TPA: phosphatidylserine decarboxylase [Oligoflexia bacterium]|nr:phosphatidylserine decarboxylase [Oligoflexia bacterium]